MKTKTILLGISFFSLIFSSCSLDDGNEENEFPTVEELIVGTWELEGHAVNGEFIPLPADAGEVEFIFKAEGTFEQEIDGVVNEAGSGVYAVDDIIVTFTSEELSGEFGVIRLDSRVMYLQSIEDYDFDEDGEEDQVVLVFSR